MFRSQDELIEEAWLRVGADKSEAVKRLSRTDLQACVGGACERLAVKVANQPNYHLLQRRTVASFDRAYRPLTINEVWHPSQGVGTGLSQLEGEWQASAANVRASAYEVLIAREGSVQKAVVEWGVKALAGHVVALRAFESRNLSGFSANDTANEVAVEVLDSGQVNIWQRGEKIADNVGTVLAGQVLRLVLEGEIRIEIANAAGTIIDSQWESATGDEWSVSDEGFAIINAAEAVAVDCFLAMIFVSANTILTNPRIGQGRARTAALAANARLLKETVQTRGSVSFLPPWGSDSDPYIVPLTHAQSDSFRAYPRLGSAWYWAWATEQVDGAIGSGIAVWPGSSDDELPLPSNRLEVVGNVIPTWADIPAQLHEALVVELIQMARERVVSKDGR